MEHTRFSSLVERLPIRNRRKLTLVVFTVMAAVMTIAPQFVAFAGGGGGSSPCPC